MQLQMFGSGAILLFIAYPITKKIFLKTDASLLNYLCFSPARIRDP
jgi:hypothetical protein